MPFKVYGANTNVTLKTIQYRDTMATQCTHCHSYKSKQIPYFSIDVAGLNDWETLHYLIIESAIELT